MTRKRHCKQSLLESALKTISYTREVNLADEMKMEYPMNTTNKGFRITNKKGFHITFKNGFTVSVQFGPGNYCDHYSASFDDTEKLAGEGSSTAECAVWGPDGEFIEHQGWSGDSVGNRNTPKEILDLLVWAETQPSIKRVGACDDSKKTS